MRTQLREYLEAVAGEGYTLVGCTQTRRHYKITVAKDGVQFNVFASVSPSDFRSIHNFRTTLRKQLRITKGVDSLGQHALLSSASPRR